MNYDQAKTLAAKGKHAAREKYPTTLSAATNFEHGLKTIARRGLACSIYYIPDVKFWVVLIELLALDIQGAGTGKGMHAAMNRARRGYNAALKEYIKQQKKGRKDAKL